MTDDLKREAHTRDRIDADAVCAECGTVNPEDTLLCKSCGNNLRDQRMRRVALGQAFDEGVDAARRRRFLTGALTALGLLIVLWVGMNITAIEDWLIDIQTGDVATARSYWTGSASGIYNDLLQELKLNPVTAAEIEETTGSSVLARGFGGRYILRRGPEPGAALIGQANVLQEGSTLYFVAELYRGVEIRGAAQLRDGNSRADVESAALRMGKELAVAYGTALVNGDGSITCYGESEMATVGVRTAFAYRIP